MKSQFTPGPWVLDETDDSIFVCPSGEGPDNGPFIALVDKRWDLSSNITHEANARLIAAAPTMLDALYYVLNHASLNGKERNKIRTAIAKAEGRDE